MGMAKDNLYNNLLFTPVTLDAADTLNAPHFELYRRDIALNKQLSEFYVAAINHAAGKSMHKTIIEATLNTPAVSPDFVEVTLPVPHFFPVITVLFSLFKEGEAYEPGVYSTAAHIIRNNARDIIEVTPLNGSTHKFRYYTFIEHLNILIGFDPNELLVYVYYKQNTENLYPKKIKIIL